MCVCVYVCVCLSNFCKLEQWVCFYLRLTIRAWCRVLASLRVAVSCSVLQCVAVCCSVLHCVALCCSVLQCVAVCCIVLHCVEVCCVSRRALASPLQRNRMRFSRILCLPAVALTLDVQCSFSSRAHMCKNCSYVCARGAVEGEPLLQPRL